MNDFQYAYQSDFNNTPNTINQSLLIIGGAIITGILIALIFILQSIALMKLAKRNNINHSWVAFIPVANTYIFGQIAFENKAKTFIFLAINIILPIFSSISLLNMTSYAEIKTTVSLFSWVYMILFFYSSYQIFKKHSNNAVMLIFSILSYGLLIPIFLFAIKNNKRKIDVK